MATKIRLQRHGKKGKPFYHVVIADSRAKRDGKFIERIGSYNPNTNPATIDVNFERAMYWVGVGAEPTNTMRAILHYKGVMYKSHLLKGVAKGAMTEEQAESKFNEWAAAKEAKIQAKRDNLSKAQEDALAKRLANEADVNAARAKALEAKNAPEVEEVAEETVEAAAEEATEEVVEAAAEVAEEAPAVEAAAEATEEAPAVEAAVEEVPATEEAPAEEGEEKAAE
jgi:small subunit ribosomal protein S16